jgi:hypothetical protein
MNGYVMVMKTKGNSRPYAGFTARTPEDHGNEIPGRRFRRIAFFGDDSQRTASPSSVWGTRENICFMLHCSGLWSAAGRSVWNCRVSLWLLADAYGMAGRVFGYARAFTLLFGQLIEC